MVLGKYKKTWLERYGRIVKQRQVLFKDLSRREIDSDWIVNRPTEHQWSIDEIIRHILAMEIRYVQQSFDPTRQAHPAGVRAQWQDFDVLIKLDEGTHYGIKDLKKFFPSVQVVSEELLREASDMDFERNVKAPWGEKLKVRNLLEAWYDHEQYHKGQIYHVLNYFRGPPEK